MGLPVITMNSTAVRDTLGGCGFALQSPEEVESGAKKSEIGGNEETLNEGRPREVTDSPGSILKALRDHSSILDHHIENGIRRYYSHFHPSALKSKLGALLEDLGYEIPEESTLSVLPQRLHTPDKVSREPRIALIVVRFGEEFAGGSEKEAFDYAHLLASSGHNVDVFSSCARNADSWENEYESGLEELSRTSTNYGQTTSRASGEIRVFRFPVSRERTSYWHRLDALLNDSDRLSWASYSGYAFNLEWIRAQGPYCRDLLHELNRASDYHRYLYMTYLYYPTILGSMLTPPEKNYLVPTLHEERPANLQAMRRLPARFRNLLWNTAEEGFLGHRLWNVTGGTVVGAPLELSGRQGVENSRITSDDAPVPGSNRSKSSSASDRLDTAGPAGESESRAGPQKAQSGGFERRKRLDKPRFLYIGRWDSGKGTDVMLSLLKQYNSIRALELQIIGGGLPAKLPPFARHMGFVSEETKLQLLENATALIVPSPMESFSIVTLEALACMTPVIVNGNNDVLRGHAMRSECALAYRDAAEFMQCLDRAIHGLDHATLEKGKAYAATFSASSILSRLKTGLQLDPTSAESGARGTDP